MHVHKDTDICTCIVNKLLATWYKLYPSEFWVRMQGGSVMVLGGLGIWPPGGARGVGRHSVSVRAYVYIMVMTRQWEGEHWSATPTTHTHFTNKCTASTTRSFVCLL